MKERTARREPRSRRPRQVQNSPLSESRNTTRRAGEKQWRPKAPAHPQTDRRAPHPGTPLFRAARSLLPRDSVGRVKGEAKRNRRRRRPKAALYTAHGITTLKKKRAAPRHLRSPGSRTPPTTRALARPSHQDTANPRICVCRQVTVPIPHVSRLRVCASRRHHITPSGFPCQILPSMFVEAVQSNPGPSPSKARMKARQA